MTDEKQSGLIEKIKKLFAMAQRHTNNDGSSNEAEATAAMARAQELLTKYNLDVAVIKEAQEKSGAAETTGKREKVSVKRSAMYRWQQNLWKELAKANFCWHWVTEMREQCQVKSCRCNHPEWPRPHIVKRHVILGSEANVLTVQLMGEYLADTIERLVLQNYSKAESLSRSANSWREGCAARLIERIQERAEKMKAEGFSSEGATCTALAVQDLHEKEYAANYDAQYGVGAYARMRKQQAEWEAKRAEREKQYADERKRREEERARTLAGETPEQRKRRETQEAKAAAKQAAADARFWERQWRKQQREAARRDITAYAKGTKAGNSINLDAQVKSSNAKGGLL